MAMRESEWTIGALAERNRRIVARHKSGATPKEIGKEFRVSAARARRIIDGMVRLDEHTEKNAATSRDDDRIVGELDRTSGVVGRVGP